MSHNYFDALTKTCSDYALVGISRSSTYSGGAMHYHVERDGRRVFSCVVERDASMFAEELYERIQLARAAGNTGTSR